MSDALLLRRRAGQRYNASGSTPYFNVVRYSGDGAAQTIETGVDLLGGGALFVKNLSGNQWVVNDTARGLGAGYISTSNTFVESGSNANFVTDFLPNGFGVGSAPDVNANQQDHISYSLQSLSGLFDVRTYVGTGSARTILHNLGSPPGMIAVKSRFGAGHFHAYHRGVLNAPDSSVPWSSSFAPAASNAWNNADPTAADFFLGANNSVNESGASYVAYLFGHDDTPGGLCVCDKYTGNGSWNDGPVVDLGWRPGWVFVKSTSSGHWETYDETRDHTVENVQYLSAGNTRFSPSSHTEVTISATGFQVNSSSSKVNANGQDYIFVAVRNPGG